MLSLIPGNRAPLRVLCLGAHCDDIEIGCGGTLLTLAATERQIEIYWLVFTSDERRKQEALKSAAVFLENIPCRTVLVDSYRDRELLPYIGSTIKDRFEQLKSEFVPDLDLDPLWARFAPGSSPDFRAHVEYLSRPFDP